MPSTIKCSLTIHGSSLPNLVTDLLVLGSCGLE